jgi:hypothetical protein
MIGDALKSHFCLKVIPLSVWPLGSNAAPMHVALQHISDMTYSRLRAP